MAATPLTNIFGTEIKVYAQPRQGQRQYAAFPGADGVVGMFMGTRGRQIVITGMLADTGSNYYNARANLQATIDAIEAYQQEPEADYSFAGETYTDVVFDKFQLVPDNNGKVFYWTSDGYVTCKFVACLNELT